MAHKFIIALSITLNLLVFVSHASFAHPPSSYAHPPSYHPKLCNFDDVFKFGSPPGIYRGFESCNNGLLRICQIDKIFQLGDSLSDVGNLIREVPVGETSPFARLPYGNNFPTGPTGRASNGYLMIDYYAMDAGLPLIPPFKKRDADFSHGVNFAVATSTALPWHVLADMNVSSPMTTSSLSVQLDWTSSYLNSMCNNQIDCGGKLDNALFILGPFGASDYENALFQGKSVNETKITVIPKVVDHIMAAVDRLISLGAKKVLVPGIYTIFSLPIFRTATFFTDDMWDPFEDIAIYHSVALRHAIEKLNREGRNGDAVVIFGDYYNAYQALDNYAVDAEMNSFVCCGTGGGEYKFDVERMCGTAGVSACSEHKKTINWDGLQLTQEAYRVLTKYMLHHIFRDLHCIVLH